MDLKKAFGSFVLIGAMMGCSLASATDIKDFPRVAVMNIGNKAITSRGLRDQDFSSATEYAIYQLSASGWFDLIDYEQLGTIAQMHSINMSDMVDTSTAVQFGKIAGAEYMVVGYVTGLTTKENIAGLQAGNAKGSNAQHVVTANVALRIVDIKTGRIMVAGLGKGSSTSTLTEIGFTKYRTKENIRSKNVGSKVINDVRDELTTRKTKQNTTTKDTDNREISENTSNSYNRNDKFNNSDSTTSSGSSSFDKKGGTNSGSFYNEKSNQNGTASSDYRDRGYSDRQHSESRDYNDSIRDRENKNYYDEDGRTKSGSAWGNSNSRHDSDWSEGGSSLNVSGGPAVGVTTGKNQNQSWDEKIYNDKADWHRDSRDGESHSQDSSNYNKNYQDNDSGYRKGDANYNRDHDRNISDRSNSQDYRNDGRDINSNSRYNDNQSRNGQSGSFSKYNDSGKNQYQNNTQRDQNMNYDSNIKQNTNNNYKNSGDEFYSYNGSYEDSLANKANNSTRIDMEDKFITYDKESTDYKIVIGTVEVSDVQVRNAISKAVRDAIYGNMGILTTLNNGKKLKIKTGF